jgi:hypothetical protein
MSATCHACIVGKPSFCCAGPRSVSGDDTAVNRLDRGEQQFSDVAAARDEGNTENGAYALLASARHTLSVAGAAVLLCAAFRFM